MHLDLSLSIYCTKRTNKKFQTLYLCPFFFVYFVNMLSTPEQSTSKKIRRSVMLFPGEQKVTSLFQDENVNDSTRIPCWISHNCELSLVLHKVEKEKLLSPREKTSSFLEDMRSFLLLHLWVKQFMTLLYFHLFVSNVKNAQIRYQNLEYKNIIVILNATRLSLATKNLQFG